MFLIKVNSTVYNIALISKEQKKAIILAWYVIIFILYLHQKKCN